MTTTQMQRLESSDLYFTAWVLAAIDEARLAGTSVGSDGKVTFRLEGSWGESDLRVIYVTGGQVDGLAMAIQIKRLKRIACSGKPR